MNLISLLTFLMSAAPPDDQLMSGRGFVERTPLDLKFGLSGGFGSGPREPLARGWWATGELSVLLELTLSPVSLRAGLGFRPGSTDDGTSRVLLGAHAEFEVRLHPVERFSFGAGVELGFLSVGTSRNDHLILFVAPRLTIAALRLGPSLQHELSLSGTLLLWPIVSNVAGGFGFIRYAYFF